MRKPQDDEPKPGVDKAPRLTFAFGVGVCVLLLALVILAIFAVIDESDVLACPGAFPGQVYA